MLVFGTAYLVLPALLISLSPRWQHDLYWGVGYLPVYIEFFGVALIALALVYWLIRAVRPVVVRRVVVVVIALAIAVVGVVNFQNNRVMLQLDNAGWQYSRAAVETALDNGVASLSSPQDTLLTVEKFPFATQGFVYFHTGKMLTAVQTLSSFTASDAVQAGMVPATAPAGLTAYSAASTTKAVWCLGSTSSAKDSGAVAMCLVQLLQFKGPSVVVAFVIPLRALVVSPTPGSYVRDAFSSTPLHQFPAVTLQRMGIDGSSAQVTGHTSTWTQYTLSGNQRVKIVNQ
jgi:hypothetical protein